jgi:ABC-type glycerol-3-phosphate transport system substrate-binding protein
MNMKGKTKAAVLCISLIVGLTLGGCKKEQQDAAAAGPVKLTFLTNVNVDTEGYDINDHPYVKFLEEKFNVDLDIVSESTNYAEKLNTTMASGKLPDYFNAITKNDLQRWASEGLVTVLDPYLEKAPALKDQIMPLAWELSSYEGKVYAVPLLRYDSTPYLMFARKDWMNKFNIKPENVKTMDDWYAMLKAFAHNDPDGNGRNDTYGWSAPGSGGTNGIYIAFLDAFNAAKSLVINGEVIPYFLTPGYKDYLKWLHKLYAEGIIDPTFLITSNQQHWDKISAGTTGAFMHFWMTTELRSKGFDVENLVAFDPPLKADGSGTKSFYKYGSPIRTYTAISSTCKNPEKIIEILNWACTEDGGVFVLAGTEGMDYTKTSAGGIDIKAERRGKNSSLRFILLGTQKPKIDTPLLQELMRQAWGDTGLAFLNKSSVSGGYDEIDMLAPYFPELALYDLDQPVLEFRDLAVLGKVNIDSEWDNYVKRWRNAGGNEKIRLTTEWYNKYNQQ